LDKLPNGVVILISKIAVTTWIYFGKMSNRSTCRLPIPYISYHAGAIHAYFKLNCGSAVKTWTHKPVCLGRCRISSLSDQKR
ncbi:MAG: hypothetical protein OXT74_06670, partial [Candidatus Poribacteria bacterium]|nr:hypothetical protein [Candidatus Poribacteria bacterium]